MIWIGMEISMLSFLLVLIFSDLYQEHSNTVKYFSIQSMDSIILISELKMLSILVTMMKLGMAPFHLWFMSLMSKISISSIVSASAVQKLSLYVL